jgi:hypothetical protein
MAKTSAKKAENFMGIEGVNLFGVVYEFSQDSDSCQTSDEGQSIKIFTEDAGGGSYILFSTERWSLDNTDIDKFAETLKRIVNIPEDI